VLPNFLVVAAVRSGTTSLNHYLRAHPEVYMAPRKELRFFNRHYDRGLDWYEAQFDGAGDAKAIGEATPSYMFDPVAVERIGAVLPQARLIAIIRQPVDRAYSNYWMAHSRGWEQRTFEQIVDEEIGQTEPGPYLGPGRYIHQLRRLGAAIPRAPVHVMLTEQLEAEPLQTYGSLCGFLGVDPNFVPSDLGRRVNRYVEFRSLGWRRLAKRSPGLFGRALEAVNVRRADYPQLDQRLRRRLDDFYAEDNAALGEYLGIDLDRWWR
jgi:hypothetical protein